MDLEQKTEDLRLKKEIDLKTMEVYLNNNWKLIQNFGLIRSCFKATAEENRVKLEHLEKLKQLNVNLTDYLVSEIYIPEKRVKITNSTSNTSGNNAAPNLHLHD